MKKSVLAAIVLCFAALLLWVRADRFGSFPEPVFVEIPKGTSSLRIGALLADAGVIRNPLLFPLARLAKPWAKPQAGEYRFSAAASPAEVFARIARGDVYLVEVMVPEGSNIFDIGRILEQHGLARAAEFAKEARGDEGYLFPSTYRFHRRSEPAAVRRVMREQFEKIWQEAGGPRASMARVMTIASLVEKEAVLEEERPRIAAVFWNRLEKGMKLECDPTVEYAALLEGKWTGVIHQSDLKRDNRYNTYVRAGLPPGPIANPGLESIKAALHPARTGELYFVAKPDRSGAHVFNRDYAAHQKAVAAYRNGGRKAVKESQGAPVAAKPRRAPR